MFSGYLVAGWLLAAQASIHLYPPAIALSGPGATQRLLVLQTQDGDIRSDVTKHTKLTSSNLKVATIGADGVLHAAADGEAIIASTHGDSKATAKVKVQK